MQRLLLHTCCANCVSYPYLALTKRFHVTLFFYNPNISPQNEYRKRLRDVKDFAALYDVDLLIGSYDVSLFQKKIKGLEKEKEGGKRCNRCFHLRLGQTQKRAMDDGFDLFTTTLSVSPHKNAHTINTIGESFHNNQVAFYKADFKKHHGYRIANGISKCLDFYRQDYCGCLYSIRK